jgi:uncharacterized membrane protein YfbV (UPF0208 family)
MKMIDALKRLASSMKFWTAVIALIAIFAARYGFEISEQMTALVGAIFAVLLGGQGLADHGKEAAKAANDNAPQPPKLSA